MLKLISYLSAKPGMPRQDFVDYYENHHVPLVRRLLPMVGAYRRCYVDAALLPYPGVEPDYDVVTEMVFADESALQAFWQTAARPDVQAAISADLALFLDTASTRMVAGEERSD